jgi:predicted transcriptional regulator
MTDAAGKSFIDLTANIVSAYLSNNPTPASEIPGLINQIHAALVRVSTGRAETPLEPAKPAVSVKKSMTPDYLICLEDGKRFKSLKRHLRSQYNMTPEQYREKWGCAELCGGPFATRQENGPWPAAATAQIKHRAKRAARSHDEDFKRRESENQVAAASVSRASARIRSTIARKPLERCGVRCSRNPNSSNIAMASVERICFGV